MPANEPKLKKPFHYRSLTGSWQVYENGTLRHIGSTTDEQAAILFTDSLNACSGFVETFGPSVDAYANYDGKGNHGAGWGEIESVENGREVLRKAGLEE